MAEKLFLDPVISSVINLSMSFYRNWFAMLNMKVKKNSQQNSLYISHLVKQIVLKSKFREKKKKKVSGKLENCNNDMHLDFWLLIPD